MTLPVSRTRISRLLQSAVGKRVLVIGDVMLDVYLAGDVTRISPEAPVPVVRVRERRYALGGAANVAQNVKAVGATCDLIATLGRDAAGDRMRTMLREMDVGAGGITTIDRCTTQKTRVIARSQQLVRVDEEVDEPLSSDELATLHDHIATLVHQADAVILEDYNKGVLTAETIRWTMQHARTRGVPIVVDPKYRNFFEFRGATIFKPNVRELEAALGAAVDVDHPETLPSTLLRLGVEHILLTLGEKGMVLFSERGEIARVPTAAREVYDVVGAGDTVTAYLATMLAAGSTVEEAAYVANIAAGIEVGKLGAATVSGAEVLDYLATSEPNC